MAQEATIFSTQKISDLGISEWLIENCKTMGMERATKVQSEAIPHILKGKDVVVRAKTGSGKTAAFALPILEHLSQDPYGIFAIVLTPTRELACQIGDQFIALSANTGFKTAIAYGGSGYITNTGDIEDRPHILIATPGRLADLIKCGMEFDVEELKYLVIDEADQLLLNHNFNAALETIFKPLPSAEHRQTLLFSATLDKSMKDIFNLIKCDTERMVFIETSLHKLATVNNITQMYCFIPEMTKETYLVTLCTELTDIKEHNKSVIIFVSSKEYCMIIARLLKNFQLKISELHANMKQKKRLNELMRFRSGITNVLVATDLAARGLDIPQVEYIINFDIPRSGFEYIHRIGRCGRIDRRGTALTFVSQFDIKCLKIIERQIKYRLKEFKVEKYQKLVLQQMQRVLIIRAGIINSVETKYLLDPHHFKRDATLRWNGKFTDPRILGKINLKPYKRRNHNAKASAKEIENKESLYHDFKNAFDNEFEHTNDSKQEELVKLREERFYKQLKKKEKKLNVNNTGNEGHGKEEAKEENDEEDLDTNMVIMDEEVRLNNLDVVKQRKNLKPDAFGKDYHEMHGWQSFRVGKDGKKIKRMERMQRAKDFQMKRKAMELKRSKRENRKSELDLFSIYEKTEKEDGAMKKVVKRKIKKQNKFGKGKKKDDVKISKSLRKKLSDKEQQVIKDRKRSWFKNVDIEWQ